MARDGVGAERVENDETVVPARSRHERVPRISQYHPGHGWAGLQEREVSRVAGDAQDGGVDLVERELLPRAAMTRQGAGPEPDDRHRGARDGRRHGAEHLPDRPEAVEIDQRLPLAPRLEALAAMLGGAIHELSLIHI